MTSGPSAYLEEHPNAKSVRFGGRYIDLLRLAHVEGLDHGYLSRILAGQRTPSIAYARRIAAALRMSLEDFLEAVDDRKQERSGRP